MRIVFAGIALVAAGLVVYPAEAKSKKHFLPSDHDSSMTALPGSGVPEVPPFHWAGRSSWGRQSGISDFPNESVNGG